MRVEDEVHEMQKLVKFVFTETGLEQRQKWRNDFDKTHRQALAHVKSLREEITQAERELAVTYRARWHAVGASALTAVVLVLGCLLFWVLFDRELRRSWKARARLAGNEARFRSLVEGQAEPIAVLDTAGTMLYVNPAWQTAFGYRLDELQDGNLFELIHEADRPRVLVALRSEGVQRGIPCRLRADYGVWHDVELHCQPHDESVVRIRDVRETPDVPLPQPELLNEVKLKETEARLAEVEKDRDTLRELEAKARGDLEHHRWLLDSHRDANSDGALILSAQGDALSWNPAFVRLWKLSNETMAGHTWQTVAAHMESQVHDGWDDFQKAATPGSAHADSCWEMTLEGERTLEVYAQALPGGATQFQFRDVTNHKVLETQLREHRDQLSAHEGQKQSYESSLREQEKRLKQLEKQQRERDQYKEEMETTLRDHQDRLHQMHDTHEAQGATLKSAKDAMRRLAGGLANDVNSVLSVVIGNTEVLRDNLPPDHVAQNYLEDILQAAGRGTELTQRLLALSRKQLLQPAPVEIHAQLASLEPKLRVALGHVQLQWQRGSDELWAKTDPHPLEQAILHLATHAKARMPNSGSLTIRTQRVQLAKNELTRADMKPGNYVRIQLTDTGAAMDDESLAHVFEPYHSVIQGQKGDLALATAYGIVRQAGGCIEASSDDGKGTTWTILLPETNERPQAALRASA
jgi:PAS domain S-box-containing protein